MHFRRHYLLHALLHTLATFADVVAGCDSIIMENFILSNQA